jgi:DinB superfamily
VTTVSLVQATEDVLRQGLALLSNLDDAQFPAVAPAPYKASIGQHYRHVLDHFLCLDAGIVADEINYDARERNPRLETDLEYARATTERLIRVFRNYDFELMTQRCTVCYSVGYGNASPVRMTSVVAREMAFCIGHAVHHYAIVRLLCDSVGVGVADEFGVAPSTLKYRSEQLAS